MDLAPDGVAVVGEFLKQCNNADSNAIEQRTLWRKLYAELHMAPYVQATPTPTRV